MKNTMSISSSAINSNSLWPGCYGVWMLNWSSYIGAVLLQGGIDDDIEDDLTGSDAYP